MSWKAKRLYKVLPQNSTYHVKYGSFQIYNIQEDDFTFFELFLCQRNGLSGVLIKNNVHMFYLQAKKITFPETD
jgi:hypothetical protein